MTAVDRASSTTSGDTPTPTGEQIPLVDYLVLGDDPHLVAHECDSCGARYFDHRNACARCSADTFHDVTISREGTLHTFTIVSFAAPGITVPFVAAIVDCGGTLVRANLANIPADADHVRLGMRLRLTTTPMTLDSSGVLAVGFGFEPIEGDMTDD